MSAGYWLAVICNLTVYLKPASPISLGHCGHPTTAFGAAAAGFGTRLHLRVIAHLLATRRALLAHLGAGGTSVGVKV